MTSAEAGIGAENPYPGLSPFDEEQAHLFFGRKDQIRELLARMEEHRFVGVVGLSGSGKSSLVRAGLIPTLRRGRLTVGGLLWRVATLRPGANPINQLANALNGALGTDSGRLGIL